MYLICICLLIMHIPTEPVPVRLHWFLQQLQTDRLCKMWWLWFCWAGVIVLLPFYWNVLGGSLCPWTAPGDDVWRIGIRLQPESQKWITSPVQTTTCSEPWVPKGSVNHLLFSMQQIVKAELPAFSGHMDPLIYAVSA